MGVDVEKVRKVFRSVFNLGPDVEVDALSMESFPEWDSMAHINLILALELDLGVSLSPEEVGTLYSFETIVALLESK